MILRRLSDILGSEREVHADTWSSRRLLLADDRMGFSLHDTLIRSGTTTRMCYRNHLEAVYCIAGSGTVEDLATGSIHAIAPGTFYALDKHDDHALRAETELRLICVFNPALIGGEVHDATGAYPAATPNAGGGE